MSGDITMNFLMRAAVLLTMGIASFSPGFAQDVTGEEAAITQPSSTGGASTLDEIMRRQAGEQVDRPERPEGGSASDAAAGLLGALGTRGGTSDAEVWEELRLGTADVRSSSNSPASEVLVQDGGMWWLEFRAGPLRTYGSYLLYGVIILLALFYILRGKIKIEGAPAGRTIQRFKAIERFGHWLLAGSFIVLGITGLLSLFGRVAIIPLLGKDAYAPIARASKWVHNNVSWAFMLGLAMIFVMWVVHNLPSRHDLVWLAKGGGLFTKGSHPPAKKFNAGQKIIFWSVVLLGTSISISGLSLLFPFEMPMFAATFAHLNDLGISQVLTGGELPAVLTPHEEMQYAQLWHAIVSFVLMAIILAHIYIGSVGMEGAYDAMGSGEVDLQWAKEHHSLWAEDELAKIDTPPPSPSSPPTATPAE